MLLVRAERLQHCYRGLGGGGGTFHSNIAFSYATKLVPSILARIVVHFIKNENHSSSIVIEDIRTVCFVFFFTNFKKKKPQIQLLTNLRKNLAH